MPHSLSKERRREEEGKKAISSPLTFAPSLGRRGVEPRTTFLSFFSDQPTDGRGRIANIFDWRGKREGGIMTFGNKRESDGKEKRGAPIYRKQSGAERENFDRPSAAANSSYVLQSLQTVLRENRPTVRQTPTQFGLPLRRRRASQSYGCRLTRQFRPVAPKLVGALSQDPFRNRFLLLQLLFPTGEGSVPRGNLAAAARNVGRKSQERRRLWRCLNFLSISILRIIRRLHFLSIS